MTSGRRKDRPRELGDDPGRPLPPDVKASAARSTSTSLDHVRVHVGGTAERLTAEHNAHAVSYGSTISFSGRTWDPDSLVGRAILNHELAHVIEQQNAGQERGESHDSAGETRADVFAAAQVARQMGHAVGSPAALRSGRPLTFQTCKKGSALDESQRDAVTAGIEHVSGHDPLVKAALLQAYGTDFGNLREDALPTATHGETKWGVSALAPGSFSMAPELLGALVAHEVSHLRDTSNAMGMNDAAEGYAYAIERVMLERAASNVDPDSATRQAIDKRVVEIYKIRQSPPAMHALVPAFRVNFDAMILALSLLYRKVDGEPVVWGEAGSPKGWGDLDAQSAQKAVVDLMTVQSSNFWDETKSGFIYGLMRHVKDNEISIRKAMREAGHEIKL